MNNLLKRVLDIIENEKESMSANLYGKIASLGFLVMEVQLKHYELVNINSQLERKNMELEREIEKLRRK